MLRDIQGKEVRMPTKAKDALGMVLAHLTDKQRQAMVDKLNETLDEVGHTQNDFIYSGWTPGKNWEHTPFEPLYDACEGMAANQEEYAAFMFGWLFRQVVIERKNDDWVMDKDPEAGTDAVPRNFWSTNYWQANRLHAVNRT